MLNLYDEVIDNLTMLEFEEEFMKLELYDKLFTKVHHTYNGNGGVRTSLFL